MKNGNCIHPWMINWKTRRIMDFEKIISSTWRISMNLRTWENVQHVLFHSLIGDHSHHHHHLENHPRHHNLHHRITLLGILEWSYPELPFEIDAKGVSDIVPHCAVAADAVSVWPFRVKLHAGRVDGLNERLLPSPELELVPDEDTMKMFYYNERDWAHLHIAVSSYIGQ